MIHVCYALNDSSGKYSKFLGTSIQSLLENTSKEVTIHIVHDSTLTRENQKKLRKLVYSFDRELIFYNVEKYAPSRKEYISEKISRMLDRFSVACFYRTMIPELFSSKISKVIYLDADTIVNLDIEELWNIDLNWFPLAAIPQMTSGHTRESLRRVNALVKQEVFKWDDYFNSGVLVMDLNMIREFDTSLFEKCIDALLQYPEAPIFPDQNALNLVFKNNYRKLPAKFNRLVHLAKKVGRPEKLGREIIHYSSQTCGVDFRDKYNRLWFSYYCRTPFCSADILMELFKSAQDSNKRVSHLWRTIENLALKRAYGFFIYPQDVNRVIGLIGKRESDIGLNASFPNAIDNLISVMEENRGSIVFFINVKDKEYPKVHETLIEYGFKEYEDFFNVKELVPTENNAKLLQDI